MFDDDGYERHLRYIKRLEAGLNVPRLFLRGYLGLHWLPVHAHLLRYCDRKALSSMSANKRLRYETYLSRALAKGWDDQAEHWQALLDEMETEDDE